MTKIQPFITVNLIDGTDFDALNTFEYIMDIINHKKDRMILFDQVNYEENDVFVIAYNIDQISFIQPLRLTEDI